MTERPVEGPPDAHRDENLRGSPRGAVERGLEGAVELFVGFVGGPAASIAAAKFFDHRRARVADVGRAAAAAAGREALTDALANDERIQDLAFEAAEAGWRSSLTAKRITLGMAVGRAVTDRAAVDDSQFVITALRDLDSAHLQTLKRMETVREQVLNTNNSDHEYAAEAASRAFRESHPSVRAALLRHGAVDQYYETRIQRIDGGTVGTAPRASDGDVETSVRYAISNFGRRLLADVERAAAEAS